MNRSWSALALTVLFGTQFVACKKTVPEDERGAAPPPSASAKPGVCTGGGGTVTDPVSAPFFARTVGDYCIDPNGDVRAYGEDAKNTLDDVCTQQLDGECEVYKSFGLRRVVTVRYVDGLGSPGAVAVTLSRFASKEGAYGFFTKRVVADGDPASITLADLDAGAEAALGSGVAYVFRGEYLAELSYTNEQESPDQMRASGKRVLPPIARALGEKIPGDVTLPAAVAKLPTENRLRMGVTYIVGDVLGISGLGGGAVGYYQNGTKRYRVFVLVRSDEDAAKDVLETLRKVDKASVIKDVVFPALTFDTEHDDSSPRTTWVVGRRDKFVFGVGDEEFALGPSLSKDEEQKRKLSKDEKLSMISHLVGG